MDLAALAELVTTPSQADPALGMATQPSDVDFSRARPMTPAAGFELEDPNAIDWDSAPSHPSFDPAAEEADLATPHPEYQGRPAFDPAAETAELGPPLQSQGTSRSVSTSSGAGVSGYSVTKNEQIAKGAGSRLDRKLEADRVAIEARYAPIREAQIQTRAYEQQAMEAVAKREQESILESARLKGEMAHLFNDFKNKEENEVVNARVAAEQAKADYRAALADFSATNINPGQLWSRMDDGDQFAMGVNAFTHDFLQAGGVKSSSMEIFNKAVDRNINAQISNLDKKGQVATGFKQLWDMQRAQSASDAEARARIRGFALDSALKQVESQMGQYDSNLAGAKLLLAKAAIQKEMVQNDLVVMQQIDKVSAESAGRRVQAYGDELRASTASAQMRSAERISAADNTSREKVAAMNQKPAEVAPDEGVLYDLTKSGKGEAKWRIKKEYINDKAFVKEIINKTVKTNKAVEGLRELIELQAKIDSAPPGMQRSQLLGELERREVALRDSVLNAMLYDDSGKAINEAEAERHRSMMPAKGWFTNGSNRSIIAQTLNQKLHETNDLLKQTTNPILNGDRAFGTFSQHREMGEAELIESDLIKTGTDKVELTEADKSYSKTTTPDAAKAVDNKTTTAHTENRWDRYVKHQGGLSADDKRGRLGTDGFDPFGGDVQKAFDPKNPDAAFVELSRLWDMAKTDPSAKAYFNDALDNTVKAANYTNSDPNNPDHWSVIPDPSEQTPEALQLHEYAKFIDALENGKPMSGVEAFVQGTQGK